MLNYKKIKGEEIKRDYHKNDLQPLLREWPAYLLPISS